MNSETSENVASRDGPGDAMEKNKMVHRMAQKVHETVDKLEHRFTSGSDKVMSMQHEYGSYTREQIKAHPLSIVACAFALGLLLGRILR